MDFGTTASVVAGGLITIVTALFVEFMRRPKLSIQIESPPQDADYSNRPAKSARYLRVLVGNRQLPTLASWIMREAAMRAQAEVTFHHYDSGRPVFLKPMPGRWAAAVEPVPLEGTVGGHPFRIFDPARWTVDTRADIAPGEKPLPLDVAVRFDEDSECYGWNNESYFCDPKWRNANRVLPRGQYLVKVTVRAAGRSCAGVFVLNNAGTRKDLSLALARPDERRRVETP